jgi:drug/metabolite transporter (DMT)-like permease
VFSGIGPRAWIALVAVYLVWGSTYLAIRVVIETIPSFLSASIRFLVAGAIMYAIGIRRGDRVNDRPTREHWRNATIIGGALLLGGNGLVVVAEHRISSGMAALLVGMVPLWIALFDAVLLRRRISRRAVMGLILGFAGVALLVGPRGGSSAVDLVGAFTVVCATLSWSLGSLFGRTAALPARPLVFIGMQMLGGGALLLIAGTLAGEWASFDIGSFSFASVSALAYLIFIGAIVGYTAYIWLLRNVRTTIAATYAYVNPLVAVVLGAAILSEEVDIRTAIAGAIIVAGVATIISSPARAEAVVDAA